jgi:hypothetical protein
MLVFNFYSFLQFLRVSVSVFASACVFCGRCVLEKYVVAGKRFELMFVGAERHSHLIVVGAKRTNRIEARSRHHPVAQRLLLRDARCDMLG